MKVCLATHVNLCMLGTPGDDPANEPPEFIVTPEMPKDRELLRDLMKGRYQGIGFEADGYWYRIERNKIEHAHKGAQP